MTNQDITKSFLAGLFFIIGIFLVIAFIFTLGKDKGLAESKFQIEVYFRNVGGISEGAPVRLSGVNVGNVTSIDFLDEPVEGRAVVVTVNIMERFRKQFNNGINFAIVTEGVLGEKIMEITMVEGKEKFVFNQPVIGEDSLDVAALTEVFSNAAQSFTKTAEEMSQIDMVELSEVMRDSSKALLKTSEGLNEVMIELYDITRKSKRIFDRIEQKVIDGELFKVF